MHQSHQQVTKQIKPPTMERVTWNVTLSNGEDYHEYIKPFEHIQGESSPWGRLMKHLEDANAGPELEPKDKLRITALWLATPHGARLNLPSAGSRDPRFRPFSMAGVPTRLRCFRSYAEETGGQSEWCTVAEAEYYGSHKVQIWVSEHDPRISWVLALVE